MTELILTLGIIGSAGVMKPDLDSDVSQQSKVVACADRCYKIKHGVADKSARRGFCVSCSEETKNKHLLDDKGIPKTHDTTQMIATSTDC